MGGLRFSFPLVLVAAVGCSGRAPEAPDVAVAYLGDEPQTLVELERYLEANLLGGEDRDSLAPDELREVQSRLFDAFVEERLLLVEAEQRGIRVTDGEVESYLGLGREVEEAAVPASRWLEVRRRLMIEKLHEQVALELPPIGERDVDEYLERHQEDGAGERRLRLRSLMLPERDADRVYQEIRRRRMTYDEAVVAHGAYEGHGVATEVSLSSLSDELRQALQGLQAGQVSPPVEVHGETYLFQVESWLGGAADPALRRRARERLERQRLDEAFTALLHRLRAEIGVILKPENLPFEYVPESGAGRNDT
jgi:hypothetical protein